MHNDD